MKRKTRYSIPNYYVLFANVFSSYKLQVILQRLKEQRSAYTNQENSSVGDINRSISVMEASIEIAKVRIAIFLSLLYLTLIL